MTRRFLSTSRGQLHARFDGSGQPIVLLHTTPGSGEQFGHVMPLFAEAGFQVWAIDQMGNGNSDPLPDSWSFELAAQVLGEALDDAGLDRVILAGGHMSGQVAVELACQRPALVDQLVIDSIPLWDRQTREAISGQFDLIRPDADEAGNHLATHWQRAQGIQRAWNPAVLPDSPRIVNALVNELRFGISHTAQRAFLNYDIAPKLEQLDVPTLVTSAELDTLRDQFEPTLASIEGAIGYLFPGAHPTHCDDRGGEYVGVVDAFLRDDDGVEFLRASLP